MSQKIKIGKTSKKKISFLLSTLKGIGMVWYGMVCHTSTLQCAKYGGNLFFEVFPNFDSLGHSLLNL